MGKKRERGEQLAQLPLNWPLAEWRELSHLPVMMAKPLKPCAEIDSAHEIGSDICHGHNKLPTHCLSRMKSLEGLFFLSF